MNRNSRESMISGGRNFPLSSLQQHRCGLSLNGISNSKDSTEENLDLFSKCRRSFSVSSSDESDASVRLGRLSTGSAKQGKSGLDDLLSSTDSGKHDYDWLLTPPGTPLVPSSDGNESQRGLGAARSSSLVRSISTIKSSRLSVSQSESNRPTRPTRSSSVTSPSVSSSQYSTYSNKSTSILNTSSASITSYIRPSTPYRSSSTTRPSTLSARPLVSRSSTPSKARPSPSTSSIDKPRSSRPSTPTSRPQISANLNSAVPRSTSRPSTPTRRNPAPSSPQVSGLSVSDGRTLPNGHNVTSVSRPISPGSRVRSQSQPIKLPDFPHETPPNLRTTLPDRPLSAGRSRPSVKLTVNGNLEPTNSASTLPRRHSSPVVSRARVTEPTGRTRTLSNVKLSDAVDSQKEFPTQKPIKTSTESMGFGRNISKKYLDVAIRHMDIRNGNNGVRPLTGSNLLPQSIRCTEQKSRSGHLLSAAASGKGSLSISNNGATVESGYRINKSSESDSEEYKYQSSAKLINIDIYESSRYDMILLKEDMKNANWLHSLDDKSEQEPLFDIGFEPLPEPFDHL